MYIDANSLQVSIDNGTTWVNLGQYISEAKFGYNKLYANDTGRNLKGIFSGSLIGIFIKIIVTFVPLNQTQLNTIAPILDSPRQKVRYYDPNKNTTITMTTYTGDWENSQQNIGKTQTFNVSFIATEKRP
jgi:hypothetical protein